MASENDVYPLLVNNFKPIYLTLGRWTCENTRSDDFQKAGQHLLDLVNAGQAKAVVQDNVNLIRKNYQLLSGQDDLELG